MKLFLILAMVLGIWTQPMLAESNKEEQSSISELELNLSNSSAFSAKIRKIIFGSKTITFLAPKSGNIRIDEDEEEGDVVQVTYDKFGFNLNAFFNPMRFLVYSPDFSDIFEPINSWEKEGKIEVIFSSLNKESDPEGSFIYDGIVICKVLKDFKDFKVFKKKNLIMVKVFGNGPVRGHVVIEGSSKDLIEMVHLLSFVRIS